VLTPEKIREYSFEDQLLAWNVGFMARLRIMLAVSRNKSGVQHRASTMGFECGDHGAVTKEFESPRSALSHRELTDDNAT
jgi:hypothetical protein